jgi:hypothetical protein
LPALLAGSLRAPILKHEGAGVMSKLVMSIQDAALMLIESAGEVSADEFAKIADMTLEDNSPGEIEAIAAHMPPALRRLLPKRTLH